MKKILFILLLFSGFITSAQVVPGYTNINARYQWEAGIFKGLRIPAGDSAQFRSGQAQHAGSQYWDSTNNNTPSGLYIWDGTTWELQSSPVQFCDQFNIPISITYIGGFDFAASEGSYNINCIPYNSDSIHFRLDTAHDDYDRYDVFYADETGVHVLKGVAEELATIPSLELGQLFIAWVRIPANSLTPAISQAFIYNENIEWTGAQAGATVDFDNTSNVFIGSKAINWTNITSGDVITLTLASGTIDLSDYDALNLFIRPKQALSASARVWVRWYNDATPASSEVMVPINIASFNSYQAFGINLSSFTFQNTNVNRLRIRYTISNASTIAGFYLDNIFLESGLVIPGGPGNDVSIVSNIPAIDVQESNDNFTLSATGNSSQYIRGDGTLATFSAVTTVGAFGSQASNSNGAVISGSTIYFQPVTATEPGMTTPAMKASWDSSYYVQNLGDGLQIARAVDNATTGLRSLVFIGADTSASNDTTLIIEFTGGAAQRFGFATEDDAAAENRDFAIGANQFRLHSNDGSVSNFIDFWDVGNLKIGSDNVGSEGSGGHFNFGGGVIAVNNIAASSVSSLKMLAIDTAGGANLLYTTAIPAGGGGSSLFPVTGTGTATGNVIGALASNTLEISGGNVGIGSAPSVLFQVNDGTNNLISIDATGRESTISADDGTGNTALILKADETGGDVSFLLGTADGVNIVTITGDAVLGTLAHVAPNGHTFTGGIRLNALSGNGVGLVATDNDGDLSYTAAPSITKGFLTDALTINGSTTIIPRYYWYDEFQGASTAIAGSAFMMELVSGTGANASVASNAASLPGATGYGYVELTTGTTATGKAMLSGGFGATTQNQMGKVDDDFYYRCEFKNVILGDLSDGTETYKVFVGFQIDNTVSNAVYFTYTHSENSGVWNCTSHNATTPETTSTATTVAADTEYDFAIEVYNQTVKFYLNGTLVATHTTQVPPAASIMYAPSARILKSAGLTARVVYMDATGLRITHENDL